MTYATVNLSIIRGDTVTLPPFTFVGAAPTAARFYIRRNVDGTALVALDMATAPTQFVVSGQTLTITLLGTNTDGQPAGNWVYDCRITQGTTLTVIARGKAELIGDISTAATAAAAAAGYTLTATQYANLFTTIDSDGTLKAGAVDATNVIANGIITAAKLAADTITADKLADGALSSTNLAFDPYNRNFSPAFNIVQDGKLRWYDGSSCTRVNPDTSNPFGCPTIRVAGTAWDGRRLWCSEMGVKPGDVMSFAILAKVPTGRSINVALQFCNASYVTIGSTIYSATVAGDDAAHFISIDAQTIPALCTNINLFIHQVSGTGNVDCYQWCAVKGQRIFSGTAAEGPSDGQRGLAQIIATLGADTSLANLLSVSHYDCSQDPLWQMYDPGVTAAYNQNGSNRWYFGGGSAVRRIGDSANPFGTPTWIVTPNFGRKIILAEVGLVAGDVVSLGLLGKWPATSSYRVAYCCRGAADANLSNGTGTTAVGTGAVQFIAKEAITIPATCIAIEIYASRSAGSDAFDHYGSFCVKGSVISSIGCLALGYRQLHSAGGWALTHANIAPEQNLGHLQSWRRAQAGVYRVEPRVAKFAVIGDSITAGAQRYYDVLLARLAADVGTGAAGVGWVSAIAANNAALVTDANPKLTSITRTGTWTEVNATGAGLDTGQATSATGGDKYAVVTTMTTAKIHYLKKSGGGLFKFQIDSDGWSADIDTSNATNAFASATVTPVASGSHTLTIQVVSGSVTFLGCEIYDGAVTNGTCGYRLGMSGTNTTQWLAASASAIWQAALTQVAPDLVIVFLGANDAASINHLTYKANLAGIVANVKTALPNVDILLIAPYDHSTAHAMNDFVTFEDRVRELAAEIPCGALLLRQCVQYRGTDGLGLFADATHVNAYGGALIGGALYRALRW